MSWASAIYQHQIDNQVSPPRAETTKPDLAALGDELFPIDLLMLERADFLESSWLQEHLDLLAEGAQPNWYLKWLSDNLPKVGVFRQDQSTGSWRYQQEKGESALRAALRHPNCPVNFFGALARKTDHDLLQAMSLHLNSPLEIDDPKEVLLQTIATLNRNAKAESLLREIDLLPEPLCNYENKSRWEQRPSGARPGYWRPRPSPQHIVDAQLEQNRTPAENEAAFCGQYNVEELGHLAQSDILLDRLIAAAHPDTPNDLLDGLAKEQDPLLLYLLASNPLGPHELLLEKCLKAQTPLNSGLRWVGKELLNHRKISTTESAILLERILQVPKDFKDSSFILREIAALPQLSLRQMKTLSTREVADNHQWESEWIPEELKLLKHRFLRIRTTVRGTLVLHPAATIDFLQELLKKAPLELVDYLIKLIQTREDISYEEKKEFIEFRDGLVRKELCEHLNREGKPESAHQVLALSWPEFQPWKTRTKRPSQLFGGQLQQFWTWRAMLAQNPGLPPDWQQWLANDGNRVVRHLLSETFPETEE
jgi:hypothetical protein